MPARFHRKYKAVLDGPNSFKSGMSAPPFSPPLMQPLPSAPAPATDPFPQTLTAAPAAASLAESSAIRHKEPDPAVRVPPLRRGGWLHAVDDGRAVSGLPCRTGTEIPLP